MNDSHIVSLRQVEENVSIATAPTFSFESHEKAYEWISEVFGSFRLQQRRFVEERKDFDKKIHQKYTEYSRSQITRLIKEKKETSTLKYGKGKKRNRFKKIYTKKDAELLAEADNAYRRMSGDAMRKVFEDEFKMYGKKNTKICQKYLTDTSIVFALPTHTKRSL